MAKKSKLVPGSKAATEGTKAYGFEGHSGWAYDPTKGYVPADKAGPDAIRSAADLPEPKGGSAPTAGLAGEVASTAAGVAAGEAASAAGKAAVNGAKALGAKGLLPMLMRGAGWVGGAFLIMHLLDKLHEATLGERDKQKAGLNEREALSHSIQSQLTDQDWQSREMASQVGAYDNQRLAASGAEMGEANLSDLIRGHEDSLRAQAQMDQPSMLDLLALGRG